MLLRHRAAVAVAGFALFAGSAYAVVTSDAFVRRLVREVIARTFRGPARVEDAAFTFRDGLVIRGLEVRDPFDPTGPARVRVDELRADFGLDVLGEGPHVTSVTLVRPRMSIARRPDGTLDAAALLQPITASSGGPAPPAVVFEDGEFSYDDASLLDGGPVALSKVRARIEPAGDAWKCDVSGVATDLGPIRGTAFLAPDGAVTASVDLAALPLDPRILARLRVAGADGAAKLAGAGTVPVHTEIAYGPGHEAFVSGRVELAGVRTRVRLPSGDGAQPADFEFAIVGGLAELKHGTLTIAGLEATALGATFRAAEATLRGIDDPAGPSIDAALLVEDLVIDETTEPHLPPSVRGVLDAYGLSARIDGAITVRGPVASPELEVGVEVRDGRARYEGWPRADGTRHGFPWTVGEVRGSAGFRRGRLTFTVDGRHGPAKVRAHGDIDWTSGDELPDVTVVAEDVPLDDDLRAAFQDRAGAVFDRWAPAGTAARIDVRVLRDPHDDGPFGEATEVTLHLDGRATMRPRLLPLPLADLRGRVRILYPSAGDHRFERVLLEDVRGRSGDVSVRVHGRVETDRAVGSDDLSVTLSTTDLGGALRDAILASTEFVPQSVKDLVTTMTPRGAAAVRAEIAGDPDRRRDLVTVDLQGVSVRGYRDVPFAADSLTGTVVVDGDEARLDAIRGRALGAEISGSGRLLGISSGIVEPDVVVAATALPLGPQLRAALGPIGEKAAVFWDRMAPVGAAGTAGTRADVTVALRPAVNPTPVEITLANVHGPLRPLGIELDVRDGGLHYDGREATMHLDAAAGAADVEIDRAHFDLRTGRLEVAADLRGLRFPEDVDALFSPETNAAISASFPDRQLHTNAVRLAWDPSQERLDVTGELAIAPRPGAARGEGLEPEGTFEVHRLTFWMPPGLPVAFESSVRAAGLDIRPGLEVRDFQGTIALAGSIEADGVEMTARTEGARLLLSGFALTDATIEAGTSARGARASASASLHGGRLTARVGPGGPRVAYAGDIHLRGADLSRFAPGTEVKGTADGDVTFRNPTGGIDALQGSVELTVREGDLVRYPVISAILNVIPGAGKLTAGMLSGALDGPRLRVRDLVLRGPILSLSQGKGTVGFDGALDLTLDPGIPLTTVVVGGTIQTPDVGLRLLK